MWGLPQEVGVSPLVGHLTGTVHGSGSGTEREAGLNQQRDASGGPHEVRPVDYTEDVLPKGTHSHDCSDGGCSGVSKKVLVVGSQTHQIHLQ